MAKINEIIKVGDSNKTLNNLVEKLNYEKPVVLYDDSFNLQTNNGNYGNKNITLNDKPSNYDLLFGTIYENGYTSAFVLPGGNWGDTTIKRARVFTRYINEYLQLNIVGDNKVANLWLEGNSPIPNNTTIIFHLYGVKTYGNHLY